MVKSPIDFEFSVDSDKSFFYYNPNLHQVLITSVPIDAPRFGLFPANVFYPRKVETDDFGKESYSDFGPAVDFDRRTEYVDYLYELLNLKEKEENEGRE